MSLRLKMVTVGEGEPIVKPTQSGPVFLLAERQLLNGKIVAAFIAGAASAAWAIALWSLATPYAHAQESEQSTDNVTIRNSTYIIALNDNLKAAGEQIKDPGTRDFFDKLVASYGLDQASGNVTDDWLPDIDKIQRNAISLPLQEAGKTIQDKDIAAFYARFLKESGLAEDGPR